MMSTAPTIAIGGSEPQMVTTSTNVFTWLSKSGWIVFFVYNLSMIGLTHDLEVLAAREVKNVEAGEGIEGEEDFAKNVSAAPIRKQLGLLGLMGVGAYCFVSAPQGVRVRNYTIAFLAAMMLAWTAMSVYWSPDRSETLRELFRIGVYSATCFALARRFPARELCLFLILGLMLNMVFASIADVICGNFKPWQSSHRLQGTLHSNDLGRQAIMVAIAGYAFVQRAKPKWIWWAIIAFALAILLLSKSRTSLAALAVGLCSVHLIRVRSENFVGLIALFLFFVSASVFAFEALGPTIRNSVSSSVSLGRDRDENSSSSSLSGRFPLWNEILKQAGDHKLFGSGYGAFWTVERTKDMGEELLWFPRHAHSTYIEVIVNLGYVGLALMLALTLAAFAQAISVGRTKQKAEYVAFAAIILTQFAYGLTEAAPVLPRDQGLFNMALLFSLMLVHRGDHD